MPFLPDAASPPEGDTVQAVTTAVTHVAVALDELKDQLEIANRRVSEVAAAQITETELGRLFVRAAAFADSAIAEAEEEARHLVSAAAAEARRILTDAKVEAQTIIEEAQRSRLPEAAVEQVQAMIDGFTRVNTELTKELGFLRDALQPQIGAPVTPQILAAPPTSVPPPWTPPERPTVQPDIG